MDGRRTSRTRRRMTAGFTLLELMIVVAIIGLISAMAVPALRRSLTQSRKKALATDGRTLLTAFKQYAIDNNGYPPCCSPASEALDLATLHPLDRDGFLANPEAITRKLDGGELTAYDSPDVPGPNAGVYAVLTHRVDPSIVVVVANTDQFPGFVGVGLDGVYLLADGQLHETDE